MHDTSPKFHIERPLDLIETPIGEVGAGSVPTLGQALDACAARPQVEPGPDPLDPAVQQRVYLFAAVLTGVVLATIAGSMIALGLSIFN